MTPISDEKLMAYADGELSDDERRQVSAAIRRDPELAARVQAFVVTGMALARVYDSVLDAPIPQRLLMEISRARPGIAPKRRTAPLLRLTPGVAAVRRFLATHFAPVWTMSAVPALSVALLVGAVFGFVAHRALLPAAPKQDSIVTLRDTRLVASGKLHAALETAASGTVVLVSSKGERAVTFTPLLTFRSHTQEWCRNYELTQGPNHRFVGVACRNSDGDWRVELNTAARARATTGGFAPAQGSPVLDAVMARMIAGDIIGKADEARLINSRWK
jgi:anti-sigma factor RsiW